MFSLVEERMENLHEMNAVRVGSQVMIQLDIGFGLREVAQILKEFFEDEEIQARLKSVCNSRFMALVLKTMSKIRRSKQYLNPHLKELDLLMTQLFESFLPKKLEEKQEFLKNLVSQLPLF